MKIKKIFPLSVLLFTSCAQQLPCGLDQAVLGASQENEDGIATFTHFTDNSVITRLERKAISKDIPFEMEIDTDIEGILPATIYVNSVEIDPETYYIPNTYDYFDVRIEFQTDIVKKIYEDRSFQEAIYFFPNFTDCGFYISYYSLNYLN